MANRITIKALWFDPNASTRGYIGAILKDGTPVSICSKAKWDMGRIDSLRKGWIGNTRVWPQQKTMYVDVSEKQLKAEGLLFNMKVPTELLKLTK